MRLCRKFVYNKETKERVFTSCYHFACEDFIAEQQNPENFAIGYEWKSI